MLFVAWASLSTFSKDDTPDFDIPNMDKLVHFCFYFGAAILGTFFIRERFQKTFSLAKALVYAVVMAVSFGILMEILQHNFTSDRQGDIFDALANTCGAIVGAVAIKCYFSNKRGLKWK